LLLAELMPLVELVALHENLALAPPLIDFLLPQQVRHFVQSFAIRFIHYAVGPVAKFYRFSKCCGRLPCFILSLMSTSISYLTKSLR